MKFCAILCLIILGGCSTVSTQIGPRASQQASQGKYSILVRTGNPAMDKIVHELAVMEFSQLLDINENESQVAQSGKMEITFQSSSEGGFLGSPSTISPADATATGWYDGDRYWGGTGYSPGAASDIPSAAMLNWQNSTMLITLKAANGTRLWSADYEYKGGSDISGFWVNTAEEAARLCVKRLKARMQKDLFKGHK
jgi:uncharacterized protein YceK